MFDGPGLSGKAAKAGLKPAEPPARASVVSGQHGGLPVKHPATKKRGGDAQVGRSDHAKAAKDKKERKLEQGLEESMAGSDPVSVTQPTKS